MLVNIVETIRSETAGLPSGKIAVRSEAGDLSYAELFQTLEKIAAQLKEQGVAAGMRIGLSFPDSADYILLSLAILSLDAVLVPVTVSAAPDVVEETLERTKAAFLISSEEMLATHAIWVEPGGFYLTRYTPSGLLPDEFDEMEPAFIRFSSGTTGTSKGVLLTHPAIVERTDAADQALEITVDDTILWVLSMSFHFVVSILLFLRRGATICLCSEMFPFSFLSAVERGGGTFIYATPFHYRALVESETLSSDALNGVRVALSTAMKLPPETDAAFSEKFGFGLTEAYGIIEVGLPFVNAAESKPEGSVGKALPGYELDIRNADEKGVGDVFLRGPGMYAAYLHPWKRRESGEWFATGDTGRIDKEGFLSLLVAPKP
jgi:long-chain acyl-CoA synthetase